jgi:hypothetical protein
MAAVFVEERLVMPGSAKLIMSYVGYRFIIRIKGPASLSHDAKIPSVTQLYEYKVHLSLAMFQISIPVCNPHPRRGNALLSRDAR